MVSSLDVLVPQLQDRGRLRLDRNFYRKTWGVWRAIQRTRFVGWRMTGLWLTWYR